jgi:Asp/Glu/hydantoin racemase
MKSPGLASIIDEMMKKKKSGSGSITVVEKGSEPLDLDSEEETAEESAMRAFIQAVKDDDATAAVTAYHELCEAHKDCDEY